MHSRGHLNRECRYVNDTMQKKWEVCGRKISKEEYEAYNGLCWECWDDRMTEEIDTTEGTDEEFVPM